MKNLTLYLILLLVLFGPILSSRPGREVQNEDSEDNQNNSRNLEHDDYDDGESKGSHGSDHHGGDDDDEEEEDDDEDENSDDRNEQYSRAIQPCDEARCFQCSFSMGGPACVKCQKGYFLYQSQPVCLRYAQNRGDGISITVSVINILGVVIFTHLWQYRSRNRAQNLLSQLELNSENLRYLSTPTRQGSNQNPPDAQSQQSTPQLLHMPDFEKDSMKSGSIFENDAQKQQNQQMKIENPKYPQLQQQQKQNNQEETKTAQFNMNGYWMTQAGKISFDNFSNFHRIQHVIINFLLLEWIFASATRMFNRRGDDDDDAEGKSLLFLVFLLGMIIYWLITLIPCIVLFIFSKCCCMKNEPNGRKSKIFISFLFYLAAAFLLERTTKWVTMIDGFESQVWILLVLAGLLVIVYADKKLVEYVKRNPEGKMEALLRFRKINFKKV